MSNGHLGTFRDLNQLKSMKKNISPCPFNLDLMDLYMDLWDFSMGFNKIRLTFFMDISWELNDHLMGLNGIEGISWVFP